MSAEFQKAQQVLSSLRQAEAADAQTALPILNGLAGLIQGGESNQSIELDELRASAFLAICEVGKALHRGQPVGQLWTKAIHATERWKAIANN